MKNLQLEKVEEYFYLGKFFSINFRLLKKASLILTILMVSN